MIKLRGIFRIVAPSSAELNKQTFDNDEELPNVTSVSSGIPTPTAPDNYMSRLVKLIPAEVLTLYITFKGTLAAFTGLWALICLVLVVLIRYIGSEGDKTPPQIGQVFAASISFVLWIYATGGNLIGLLVPAEYQSFIPACIGVWTVTVPILYRGSREGT